MAHYTLDEEQRKQVHAGLKHQLADLQKDVKRMEDRETYSSNSIQDARNQIDIIKGVDDDPGLLSIFSAPDRPGETRRADKQGTINMFDDMGGGDRSTHNAAVKEFEDRKKAEAEEARPITRFDREEGSLTPEQISHGLAIGPWRDTWTTETEGEPGTGDADRVRFFAHVPATESEAEKTDIETPRNEHEARARAAWLNLVASGAIIPPPEGELEQLAAEGPTSTGKDIEELSAELAPDPNDDAIEEAFNRENDPNHPDGPPDEDEAIQDEALDTQAEEPSAVEGSEGSEFPGSDAESVDHVRVSAPSEDTEASPGSLVGSLHLEDADPYTTPPRRAARKRSK